MIWVNFIIYFLRLINLSAATDSNIISGAHKTARQMKNINEFNVNRSRLKMSLKKYAPVKNPAVEIEQTNTRSFVNGWQDLINAARLIIPVR